MACLTRTMILLVTSLSVSGAFGANGNAADEHDETAQLTKVACEAGRAYARRDLDALDGLTADDYTQTDVRGGVLKRAEWREFVRNRKSVLAVQCDTVEVRFYGEAAVVTGEWTYTMTRPEGKVTSHSRWTSVWTKYTDGWKRHVFQNTYVNPDADKCATRSRR
jgi:ketosteroid isomerase-like protein